MLRTMRRAAGCSGRMGLGAHQHSEQVQSAACRVGHGGITPFIVFPLPLRSLVTCQTGAAALRRHPACQRIHRRVGGLCMSCSTADACPRNWTSRRM